MAVTGKGRVPLGSTWLKSHVQLRRALDGGTSGAGSVVWSDWFFGSGPTLVLLDGVSNLYAPSVLPQPVTITVGRAAPKLNP